MAKDPKDIVIKIDDFVKRCSNKMEPLQKSLFNKISSELKELSLDDQGYIKRTSSNMDIISNVKSELNTVLTDPKYKGMVEGVNGALDEINDVQGSYFQTIDPDISTPSVMGAIADQAFTDAKEDLTNVGFQTEIVNAASDIVQRSITEGTSYADMNAQLRDFIVGNDKTDGKLVSYTKQILSDTLHNTSRNYNSIMTDKLGLEWFRYVGAEVRDTRPWCHALVQKEWIHQSELGAICRGIIDGRKVSLQGLMPDTNKENVVSRCGGYNCQHHMIPVSSESVPANIRRKFDTSINSAPEEDRPKRS